jgi:hypothetical protein
MQSFYQISLENVVLPTAGAAIYGKSEKALWVSVSTAHSFYDVIKGIWPLTGLDNVHISEVLCSGSYGRTYQHLLLNLSALKIAFNP